MRPKLAGGVLKDVQGFVMLPTPTSDPRHCSRGWRRQMEVVCTERNWTERKVTGLGIMRQRLTSSVSYLTRNVN